MRGKGGEEGASSVNGGSEKRGQEVKTGCGL